MQSPVFRARTERLVEDYTASHIPPIFGIRRYRYYMYIKMVTFNLAYTAPINATGSSPTLTQAQVWVGLKRKVYRAQDFVSIIEECNVLAEEQDPTSPDNLTVTREIRFKAGSGPAAASGGAPVKEVCVYFAPCRVDFKQPDGSTISNIVSEDEKGELFMTYVFGWRYPGVQEGSAEAKTLEERDWKTARTAVHGTIDTIRRMVKDSEITT
ncbi:DUF1857-domain-containing protein [Rostrohypoxylon terebratum]|nr:DUF1857-domain-containing protein [Rostrohypoxylon terebratum]